MTRDIGDKNIAIVRSRNAVSVHPASAGLTELFHATPDTFDILIR